MHIRDIKNKLPESLYKELSSSVKELRPCQEKAIKSGLLDSRNVLVCSPTASGKTLVAEMACMQAIMQKGKKAIYIVPLTSLANEKSRDFRKRYGKMARIALSIGDIDSADPYLADYDLIITTSEKLDSLIRHSAPWLGSAGVVVADEVHLMNDPGRGPTLEIILTMMRKLVPSVQTVCLSATIGNPKELAEWLEAELVYDEWRPVKLKKGVYFDGEVEFG
ncbi:MAG: DEAD/DEAH box helicase [Candidatus Woesearchaeota archaeon]